MAKDLTEALAALSEGGASTSRENKRLKDSPKPSAIPERIGEALPRAAGSGAGIASPLTEESYAGRLYWPERAITSTDGLFTLKIKPIKSMSFKDANDQQAVFQFKEPV